MQSGRYTNIQDSSKDFLRTMTRRDMGSFLGFIESAGSAVRTVKTILMLTHVKDTLPFKCHNYEIERTACRGEPAPMDIRG